MLLVYLALQPDETATYADLRTACRLQHKNSLSAAIELLHESRLVVPRPASGKDARARELRLTDQGRAVVGRTIQALIPHAK